MLWRRPDDTSDVGVGHPARDLVVRPPEVRRAAAERFAGRDRRPGHELDAEVPLDLVADRVQLGGVEVGDPVIRAPPVEHVLGRPPVQPRVDLRAPTDTAALGVGDRRAPDRGGDATGAVLPVHLLERERHDVALPDQLALLDDEDLEPCLGEQRGRRALHQPRIRRPARRREPEPNDCYPTALPSGLVVGHVSHTYA